jgi:hypothetical protein
MMSNGIALEAGYDAYWCGIDREDSGCDAAQFDEEPLA